MYSINCPDIHVHCTVCMWLLYFYGQLKQYISVASELCVIGKLILHSTRIVIPSKLRPWVLTLAHEWHPGIVNMKHRLRSKVWWPVTDRDGKILQNVFWIPASKQSCSPWANQVNPLTTRSTARLGPGFIIIIITVMWLRVTCSCGWLLQQILWNWDHAFHNIWKDNWESGENLHDSWFTTISNQWQWAAVCFKYVRKIFGRMWYRAQQDHALMAPNK